MDGEVSGDWNSRKTGVNIGQVGGTGSEMTRVCETGTSRQNEYMN